MPARRAPRARVVAVVAFVVAMLALLVTSRPAAGAGNPYLEWWTIETAHFRIHYYKGLEPVAEKLAAVAEGIHGRLVPALGWRPSEMTEIVLSDASDDANGSASALPYNTVRLFVTAPEDMSPLGDYDDWQLELLTHEYTHILHTDQIRGVPAILNSVLGKTYAPNQAQPRWILEGLAVLEESRHTGGGRNRSSIFDMYLRSDVLDDRIAPLDQVSHVPRRWPQGNLWYLYGSRFLTWITDVYGDGVMQAVAADYGRQIVPWAINRSIRRATGRTYEELYAGFTDSLRARYAKQVGEAERRGLREGARLTHHGQVAAHPRWVPDRARARAGADELLYFRDDGHDRTGFYRLPLDDRAHAREDAASLAVRTVAGGSAAYSADGALVFNTVAIHERIYAYNDLFRLPPGIDGSSGNEPERARLTTGGRAQDPDVGPDGRRIVFTENHVGTTTLAIGRLGREGALEDVHALVPSAEFEQAFTPRFSPDGRRVAYSVWTHGGYRDVRIVDVTTGAFFEIAHDRASDLQPSWSADGRWVFFSSDRAFGIPNVFAWEAATGKLYQVTNVRTGAFQPEASPDGKTLVYVGYTSEGFDLYAMPLDPSTWLEAPAYQDDRPDVHAVPQSPQFRRHRYDPLPSLRPRAFNFVYGPGTFGQALSLSVVGADAVGHHSIGATVVAQTERSDPQFSVTYAYGRLPFDFRTTFFRTTAPRGGYRYNDQQPVFIEENVGIANGIGYALPSSFETNAFALNYSVARFRGELPLATSPDPYAITEADPARGYIGAVHFGWVYSNAERFLHSIGPERGIFAALNSDVAHPALASDYTLYVLSYSLTGYLTMPWGHHHSLALHASGAMGAGSYPRRGLFYTGGFVDAPVLDPSILYPDFFHSQGIFQGGFVLRGYAPLAFIGSQFHLYNAEYRFPIVNVDRGVSTLPVFLQRVSGNLFADYGGAFDDLDKTQWKDQFHLGVGAELWIDLTMGYFLNANLRIGHARGVKDSNAIEGGQTYVVIAAPY